ncbi:hypothetical protein NQ314_000248 [Rhamnusium bicolor]|uniref:non-specific serine/threonine protein kinase n=1 Tax=Rhamnusium bicolor TaxID=1586634 RepID=A0AAV8ZVZ5_9CUCU|nr:hypothetical protein NQ314_000248 [Rhamnusium bicolor]
MSQSDDAMSVGDEKEAEESTDDHLTTESQPQSVCIASARKVSTPVSILIESLIKNICTIYETDPNKASLMYKLICDQLFRMNLIDESYTMTEFEGMRSQYQKALLHLVTSVYKVKHKLDGTEYAVKKIPIRSEGIESVRNYLSEVKTFASMNHSNIVQYKAAWLEIGAPSTNRAIAGNHTESLDESKSIPVQCSPEYIYHKDCTESFTNEVYEDSTDFEIDFEHSVTGGSTTKSPVSNCKSRKKRQSVSEGGKTVYKLDLKEIEKIKLSNKSKVKWATLYIQMALCQSTLKQWLEKRNSVSNPNKAVVHINEQVIRTNTINQILIQLLKGTFIEKY